MPKKEYVIASITEGTYTQAQVKHIVDSVSSSTRTPPAYFKKGDVYYHQVGAKRRPAIIVKVLDNIVYAIPITHEDGYYALCPQKSRFFGEGFFTNQILSAPIDYVKENFLGVFDNNKSLNQAIKLLSQLLTKVLES